MAHELSGESLLEEMRRRSSRTITMRGWTFQMIQVLGVTLYKAAKYKQYAIVSLWCAAIAASLAIVWAVFGGGDWGWPAGLAIVALICAWGLSESKDKAVDEAKGIMRNLQQGTVPLEVGRRLDGRRETWDDETIVERETWDDETIVELYDLKVVRELYEGAKRNLQDKASDSPEH